MKKKTFVTLEQLREIDKTIPTPYHLYDEQAIRENAHVALDQSEYQKRYESLVERFERAKTRLETVTAEIEEKQAASAGMDDFLTAFEHLPETLTEFTLESWSSLVDYATVYSADDIRFTFKNGQVISCGGCCDDE